MKQLSGIALLALLLLGCASKEPDPRTKPAPLHNANTLWHLQVGRDYAGQGRYELAREHLLMALASNSDPHMRGRVQHELKSVDAMIHTER